MLTVTQGLEVHAALPNASQMLNKWAIIKTLISVFKRTSYTYPLIVTFWYFLFTVFHAFLTVPIKSTVESMLWFILNIFICIHTDTFRSVFPYKVI